MGNIANLYCLILLQIADSTLIRLLMLMLELAIRSADGFQRIRGARRFMTPVAFAETE